MCVCEMEGRLGWGTRGKGGEKRMGRARRIEERYRDDWEMCEREVRKWVRERDEKELK